MPGWGVYPYGTSPWGTYTTYTPPSDFDIFCFEDVSMFDILLDPRVSTEGSGTQFVPSATTLDMQICSGGAFVDDDARLIITDTVPETFTAEWIAKFPNLPNDFTDLVNQHIYIGMTDASGPLVGFFVSKIGFMYTGSVSFSGTGDLQLDTATQNIPGSSAYISESDYWVIRAAADLSLGVVYFYVTRLDLLPYTGHELRAILPVIPYSAASTPPTDRALVSVRGTLSEQVCISLDALCLGSALIIPNIAPVANAGVDQAARTCSIIQLDGSQSFDPEGAPLLYQWRLIEAPSTSEFTITKEDGATYPLATPTGYTTKFYSTELGVIDALDPIDVGDVLRTVGEVYPITGKGIDGMGFYIETDLEVIPDNLSAAPFRVLRQRGISGATTVKPTFYPDVPGFYSFDLVVNDGDLSSSASSVVVNVLESALPRGCTPNLLFIFDYLSDFWQLVENKERIGVFWGSLAQVAASELYSLWQVEYSKSLRDIQRTFVRRWLHYDLLLGEPLPELTTHRLVFGGVESLPFEVGGGNWNMYSVEVVSDVLAEPVNIVFKVDNGLSENLFGVYLQHRLQSLADERFTVHVFQDRVSGDYIVRIDAPFPFTIGPNTTWSNFVIGSEGRPPNGSSGSATGTKTYKVDRCLEELDIQEDDFLVVGGVAYRIAGIADAGADQFPFQRVVVKEEMPVNPGSSWVISGWVQSELIDFYNGLVDQEDHLDFEVSEVSIDNAPLVAAYGLVATTVLGVNEAQSSRAALDQWPIGAAIASGLYNVYLARVIRRHYVPVDASVVDVPLLQQYIVPDSDETSLRRNLDFYVEEIRGHNALRFSSGLGSDPGDVWEGERPPNRLWAEYTYLSNNDRIEANFGIAVDLTVDQLEELPSNVDYLSAVRGLFYSFYNGPALRNLRIGAQILLGLPFAEEAGTIEEIRTDFSSSTGRILIRDAATEQIVRSYSFPRDLALEVNPATGAVYAVGDTVEQFEPLVEGVLVSDWVKDPRWFEGMMQQGVFFEVEKFHQFLVKIQEAAFSLETLLFVKNFILKIKPTYTFPRFVVVKEVDDEVSVSDSRLYSGRLLLNDSLCEGLLGATWMYDQPRPAGGGWRNQFDGDTNPATSPTFPTAESPVGWGYDKGYLCPMDDITVIYCQTYGAPFTIPFDGPFAYDTPAAGRMEFSSSSPIVVPLTPTSVYLGVVGDNTVDFNGNLTQVRLITLGDPGADPTDYLVVVYVNGIQAASEAFTAGTNTEILRTISVPVVIGDAVTVGLQAASGGSRNPNWSVVTAYVTQQDSVVWAYGGTLTAGTYCLEKSLS